jgi:hypothetical protein
MGYRANHGTEEENLCSTRQFWSDAGKEISPPQKMEKHKKELSSTRRRGWGPCICSPLSTPQYSRPRRHEAEPLIATIVGALIEARSVLPLCADVRTFLRTSSIDIGQQVQHSEQALVSLRRCSRSRHPIDPRNRQSTYICARTEGIKVCS